MGDNLSLDMAMHKLDKAQAWQSTSECRQLSWDKSLKIHQRPMAKDINK
jgi:hypothetical protein